MLQLHTIWRRFVLRFFLATGSPLASNLQTYEKYLFRDVGYQRHCITNTKVVVTSLEID